MPLRSVFNIRRLIYPPKPLAADKDSLSGFEKEGETAGSGSAKSSSLEGPVQYGGRALRAEFNKDDRHNSSESSLCSLDLPNGDLKNPRPAPPRPGSRSPPLCGSVASASSKEGHASHSRSSSSVGDDSRISSGRSSESGEVDMDSNRDPVKSFDFDSFVFLPSTLELAPLVTAPSTKTLTDTPRTARQRDGENEIQDFQRETEEAFRLALPLTEAQLSGFCGKIDSKPPIARLPSSPRLPTSPLQRSRSTRAAFPLKSLTTPLHSSSIYKSNRPKPTKSRRRTRPIIKKATVWTENAKDLKERLNYRIFNRIEVQEMLSPEKLREIRLSKVQAVQSTDTLTRSDADGSETPLEPFHMDDLPSRIGQAGVSFSPPSPIKEVATPMSGTFNQDDVVSNAAGLAIHNHSTGAFASPDDDVEIFVMQGTELDDLGPQPQSLPSAPDPAGKTSLRLSLVPAVLVPGSQVLLTKSQMPKLPLPTIPEVTVTTPNSSLETPRPSRPTSSGRPPKRESLPLIPPFQNDNFIFLPSTHFSFTTPGIQHGQIRLTKADLTHNQLANVAAALDDTLDWTAFQMAILGGAGDMLGEATDFGRPSDEDLELDREVGAWFDEFGFDGPGGLIGAAEAALLNPSGSPNHGVRGGSPRHTAAAARSSVIVPPASHDERSRSRSWTGTRMTAPAHPSLYGGRNLTVPDDVTYYGDSMAVPDEYAYNSTSLVVPDQPVPDPATRFTPGYVAGDAGQPPASTPTPPRQQQHLSLFPRLHHSPNRSSVAAGRSSAVDERKGAAKNNMLAIDSALTNIDAAATASSSSSPLTDRERSRRRSRSRGRAAERPSPDSVNSRDSLPQSPMMDLVMSKDHKNNEYVVSMGYNLSHDLGDYLQWEAQNVSGSGYY